MHHWTPYCGEAPLPGEWATHWNFAPELLIGLLLLSVATYLYRQRLRVIPATSAIALIAFIFVSPFCALGSALFTVRIVHDILLAVLLAPLLVAALRLDQMNIPGSLTIWTIVHAITFWLWHAPALYALAMSSDLAFWAMQVSITATAAIWWARIIRAPAPGATTALLATMVAMGALGALLTFSGTALYAPHWMTTQIWGMTPLEDQQIAGIIMWAPASLIYLLAAMAILYRSLDQRQPA